jgi:hypothetical protein
VLVRKSTGKTIGFARRTELEALYAARRFVETGSSR